MLSINEAEFLRLTGYIKNDYGIDLSKKKTLVETRLGNIISAKGFSSFGAYMDFAFGDAAGGELKTIVNKLTTNHTFFMRESKHFDYFSSTVLPYLQENVDDRDLRIWSAGCSTGEEPYTLQMIMHDFFGGKAPLWDKQLLATDISTSVLETAKAGIYPLEAISEIPSYWRLNYFNMLGGERVEVSPGIRSNITFRAFNLMEARFPFKKKFHAIFCRNVMIYFDQETRMSLVNKFYDSLEYGGYLFIGHSETVDRAGTPFKYIMPAVYRRLG